MNQALSTVAVLAMLLIALGFCAEQTYRAGDQIGGSLTALLLGAQAIFAAVITGAAVLLLLKRLA